MSLFQELKRRNVIRIAILYLVSSWVLLQLADVLSSLLNAPEAAGSIVVHAADTRLLSRADLRVGVRDDA